MHTEILLISEWRFLSAANDNYKFTVKSDGTAAITDYTGTDTEITIPYTLSDASGNEYIVTEIRFLKSNISLSDSNVTQITIPSNITSIGDNAFSKCSKLVSVDVHEDNQFFSVFDGVLFTKDLNKLIVYPCCKEETSYVIPEDVIYISSYAFANNKNLVSVNMHNGVIEIGNSAFRGCTAITDLVIPNSVKKIGEYAFSYT